MEIEEKRITISEVYEGYINDDEEGVTALNDRLDIRPKYQREFIYDKDKQRDVIRSVLNNLPLNVMYWMKTGKNEDGEETYEVMDGQQRTLSIMEYLDGNFSVDDMLFENLPKDVQQRFLDYKLFIYICDGTDSERLAWFKIINISAVELTDQEMRNAVYAGPWTTNAKRYFSKTTCPAVAIGGDYLKGECNRQAYLETAIKWISEKQGISIEEYMAKHQYDSSAAELWDYFNNVIKWVKKTFPVKRKEMKGLPWGTLYEKYGSRRDLDPNKFEERIKELIDDDEVTRPAGIYEYLLSGEEKHLSLRAFSKAVKRDVWIKQGKICFWCKKPIELEESHADHIKAWSKGGKTIESNCAVTCHKCNLLKGDKTL